MDWAATLSLKPWYDVAFAIQNLDFELSAFFYRGFDEKRFAPKTNRSCGERSFFIIGLHRGEAVSAQERQARCVFLCVPPAGAEKQAVAGNQTAAADRLDVGPIPGFGVVGHGNHGFSKRSVPVKTVATESDHDIVDLGTRAGRSAVPDAEQAQQDALVGDRIQIVEFRGGSSGLAGMSRRIAPYTFERSRLTEA